MIATGAHPEHIKRHLGHSSITVTMDLYGHLFPSEANAIADHLDQMLRDSQTDKRRTKRLGSPFRGDETDLAQAADQQLCEVSGPVSRFGFGSGVSEIRCICQLA